MKRLSSLLGAGAILALGACGGAGSTDTTPASADPVPDALQDVAAGPYSLDKNHAFLTFLVPHGNGLSHYRVSLTDFDADLMFDPAAPENSQLTLSINPLGVEANYPSDYKANVPNTPYDTWNEDIARSPNWLSADQFPAVTFQSTAIERTGDQTGQVTGDLTFRGLTKAVTLDVTYNGVANVPWLGERDILGFDAKTTLTRSDWGMTMFLPLVGDKVEVTFSGEFIQDE